MFKNVQQCPKESKMSKKIPNMSKYDEICQNIKKKT